MEITCTVTEAELFDAVASLPDPTTFILSLDEWVADEGFTLSLMSKLAQAMLKDYESTERHYTKQLMEVAFGEDNETRPWAPKPSDLEQATRQRETMGRVVALLKELL